MKTKSALLIAFMLVPACLAAESSPQMPAVLSLAPADALAVVYVDKPADICKHPIWDITETRREPLFAELLDATATTFSGPTMIAVCGMPWNPMSLRVEFAVQPQNGADAFFEHLGDTWLSVLGRIMLSPAEGVEQSGDVMVFRLPGPFPIPVYAAQKEGIVYGSSRYSDVSAWLEGADLPQRFTDGDDSKKLAADAVAASDLLLYCNARTFMPVAGAELDRMLPGMSALLQLDRLQFGALIAGWSHGNLDVRLSLGLAEGAGGAWDLLAAAEKPLEIASLIPADYTSFTRGAFTDAAKTVEQISRIVKGIDPDIVAEFEQECAEFREDYGFDPVADFAANLVGEWIVAARIEDASRPTVVAAVRLADPATFEQQAAALIRAFELEVETTQRGADLVYFTPAGSGVHAAWATVGDYLVMSNRPEPIFEIAEEQDDDGRILDSPALQDVVQHFPERTAKLGFVSVAQLARLAATELGQYPEASDLVDTFNEMSKEDAGVGLAVTREEGALTTHLVASAAVNAEFRKLFWRSLADSVGSARTQAKRMVSMSNIKGILIACLVYANDHKKVWPESLGVLIDAGMVLPNQFRSPLDESREEITVANVDLVSSYLYRPGNGLAPTEVVVCERELHDGGSNFGFVDGHVEWIEGAEAQELLAMMQRETRR